MQDALGEAEAHLELADHGQDVGRERGQLAAEAALDAGLEVAAGHLLGEGLDLAQGPGHAAADEIDQEQGDDQGHGRGDQGRQPGALVVVDALVQEHVQLVRGGVPEAEARIQRGLAWV